ncbi:MAG: DUF5317 domain-containing protein [Acidimicrobiia bacterium]|nr:DUF5317 domain-containing protein [Acidimicrobiia bacterium]
MTWLIAVLVVSVVVSVMRGGKLSNLPDIYARGWPLLFVGFGMQIVANFVENSSVAVALFLTSYVVLLGTIWLNRSEPGMWIAGIGLLMNLLVISLNNGMPVMEESIRLAGGGADIVFGAKHVPLVDSSRLPFLADVIPLPGSVISLGDVFLAVGLGVFIEDQLKQPLRLFRHRVPGMPGSAADS